MTDLLTPARTVVAVKFKWQKPDDAKTYDYFVPADLDLAPGDKVMVETKRGETEVEVVEIKAESELAAKTILRRAAAVIEAPIEQSQPKEDWNF